LVGEHFNEDPIAHARMADERFDTSDFHKGDESFEVGG
jgi:hypothetical protein